MIDGLLNGDLAEKYQTDNVVWNWRPMKALII